jgi:hypothetical protein
VIPAALPLLVAAFLLGGAAIATAQPDANGAPSAPVGEVEFNAAFNAMTRGDFATATAGFRAVATMAVDPELRGAANQLGRLADDYARRGGKLAFSGSPGSGPIAGSSRDQVGVSEDDQVDGGRTTFVITTTMASLYSGIVLLDLTNTEDIRGGTLLVMGSTAAGLVGSLYGTRGRTMTGGMADAYGLDMVIGVGNSLLLSGPLGLFDNDVSNQSEKIQTFVLGAAWGGAVVGLLAADHIKPTRAQVSVTSTIGLMGVASTMLGFAIFQPDDLDGNTFALVTAAGLDIGLGAGAGFASKLDWSLSRARLVGLSAFLGALAGGGTSLLLIGENGDNNSGRLAAAVTLAGLWGGFALGTHLTSDMAPDYRFRRPKQGTNAMLAPTAVKNGAGLSVVGTF